MKPVVLLFALGTVAFLAACSGGVEFNGAGQIQQFPVRTTPVVHYNLPVESFNATSGKMEVDIDKLLDHNGSPIVLGDFNELASPGHDLWPQILVSQSCSDNPTCPTPNPMPDYIVAMGSGVNGPFGQIWPPTGTFPHPSVDTTQIPSVMWIAAWILSFMNQWFLRDADGAELPQGPGGTAPVSYESVQFRSMPISIHELGAANTGFSPTFQENPPRVLHQETGDPNTFGANGNRRVQTPLSNANGFAFQGSAPVSITAMGWKEPPAQNIHIEVNTSTPEPGGVGMMTMTNVPVPGGGTFNAGGGIYTMRYVNIWALVTAGNTVIPTDDGIKFAYYLAAISCHLVGYGVGLRGHAGFTAGAPTGQEDMMNQSLAQDMSFIIAPGHQLQFVVEDLLRMQDTVNGDWQDPGPNSTLPGRDRQIP